MAVPKQKPSKSRQRLRRSHDALTPIQLVACGNCGLRVRPHHVCPNCGHYRTRKGGGRTRQVIAQTAS